MDSDAATHRTAAATHRKTPDIYVHAAHKAVHFPVPAHLAHARDYAGVLHCTEPKPARRRGTDSEHKKMSGVRKQRKKGSQGANVVSFFAFKCPGRFAPVNNLSPFDDNRSILIQQGAYMKKELGTEE